MPPSGDTEGLLLNETDGSWAAGVQAPLPANATATNQTVELASISCASAGNCTAVGSYADSSGALQGLLLTETAGSWATGIEVAPPANNAGSGFLNSVSCPSVGNCSAVGGYTNDSFGSDGLLLTETAGSWATGVDAPLPANALTPREIGMGGVSCGSAGNCSAVGSYLDSSHETQGLLLTETAGTWGPAVEAALPANAKTTASGPGVFLSSVSCPSAGNCGATGSYFDDSGGIDGLLLTETAGSWAAGVEPALPANAQGPPTADLTDTSCPSAGNCGAVGVYYYDSSDNEQGLLLTETAGQWSNGVEAALPANATVTAATQSVDLYSVSCASAGNCTAVGSYDDNSGNQVGLLIGGSPPVVKLEIAKNGTGSGTVSGVPTGIDCGSICSASFPAGTSLALTATPSPGSRFSGWWGGGCKGTGICRANTGINEQTVTATFSLLPKCVVPKLQGETLKTARHVIRTHNCTVGSITHAASRTIKRGHVISQRPTAGRRLQHGAKISLVVSKGRR